MREIKRTELSEVRYRITIEELEQYITDLEIELLIKDNEIADIQEQLAAITGSEV